MKKLLYFIIGLGFLAVLLNLLAVPFPMLFAAWAIIPFGILALLIPASFIIALLQFRKYKLSAFVPFAVILICLPLVPASAAIQHWFRFKAFEKNKASYVEIYKLIRNGEIRPEPGVRVCCPDKYKNLDGQIYAYGKDDVQVVIYSSFPVLFSRFRFVEVNGTVDLILNQAKWCQVRSD